MKKILIRLISFLLSMKTIVDLSYIVVSEDLSTLSLLEMLDIMERILLSFVLDPVLYEKMGINELQETLVILNSIVHYYTIPILTVKGNNCIVTSDIIELDQIIYYFSTWVREMIILFQTNFVLPENFSITMRDHFSKLYISFMNTVKPCLNDHGQTGSSDGGWAVDDGGDGGGGGGGNGGGGSGRGGGGSGGGGSSNGRGGPGGGSGNSGGGNGDSGGGGSGGNIQCHPCPKIMYIWGMSFVKNFQPPGQNLQTPITVSCYFDCNLCCSPPQDYRDYWILYMGTDYYFLVHPCDLNILLQKREIYIHHYSFIYLNPKCQTRVFLGNLF